MSLTANNNQKGKGNNKNHPDKFRDQQSKFIAKPGKAAGGFSKKPVKTGGTRGS